MLQNVIMKIYAAENRSSQLSLFCHKKFIKNSDPERCTRYSEYHNVDALKVIQGTWHRWSWQSHVDFG